MAKNDFKPFATGAGANVMSQADWEALPALPSGFTAGKASSAQVNKAIRQAAFIAAALAQYTANKSGLDVLDDGDVSGFIAKMTTALGKDFQGLDATLTALAGLATGANKLPYFTGEDTAAQTDLTSVGRDIIGKSTIADILTYLGLGAAAKKDIGTGAGQVPDMSSFVFNLGGSGAAYNWLPGGNLIQMGRATTSSTGQQFVNIPITYPHANFNVVAIAMDQAVPNIISAAGTTASQIAINAWGANSSGNLGQRVSTPIFWMTFGN